MTSAWVSGSYFVIAAVLVTFAVNVWRAGRSNAVTLRFAFFSLAVSVWVVGVGGLHTGTSLDIWGRVTFAGACLIPATALGFVACYPSEATPALRRAAHAALLIGGVLALLTAATPLLVHSVTVRDDALHRLTGPLYPVFLVYFLSTWAVAVVTFGQQWVSARGLARAQLQYLGLGTIISLAGAVFANLLLPLLTGRSTYSWIGPYFAPLLMALIGHAIIRHRLMDLRPAILRGLVYGVAFFISYLTLLMTFRAAFGAPRTDTVVVSMDLLLASLTVVLCLLPPVKRTLFALIEPYLYRGRIDYDTALRDATHELSHLMEPRALADKVHVILDSAFVPEFFVMFARSSSEEAFEEIAASDTLSFSSMIAEELPRALHNTKAPELIMSHTQEHPWERTLFDATGCEVAFALGRREQLSGVILLGPRKSGDPYYTRDIEFLESLGQLTSVSLENAYLYRRQAELLEYSDRLLESLDSAVAVADVSGRLTSLNTAAGRLFGGSAEMVGKPLDSLPSEIGWALAFALTTGQHYRAIELTIDQVDRGLVPVIVSAAPLHTGQDITAAFAVVTDLSAVKALERSQRRMDRLSSMARLYAGLAHEIRTPLASISTFISMLPDRFGDAEYRDTAARLLPMEVSRIVQLADRLRFMAPGENAKLQRVDLRALLNDVVALHTPRASDASIAMSLNSGNERPLIDGDPSQLTQLFVNLIRNALEAMPDGGTVAIQLDRVSSDLRVRVVDDGLGIDSHTSLMMFEPFFTTKAQGTGLGLSICREIAEFHNARLHIVRRTDGGHGSVAEIVFPGITAEVGGPVSD